MYGRTVHCSIKKVERGSKRKKQLSPFWLGVPRQEIGIIKTFRSLEEVPGGTGTLVSWEEVEEQPAGVLSSKAACPWG